MTFSYASEGGPIYSTLLAFLAGWLELVAGLLNLGRGGGGGLVGRFTFCEFIWIFRSHVLQIEWINQIQISILYELIVFVYNVHLHEIVKLKEKNC